MVMVLENAPQGALQFVFDVYTSSGYHVEVLQWMNADTHPSERVAEMAAEGLIAWNPNFTGPEYFIPWESVDHIRVTGPYDQLEW